MRHWKTGSAVVVGLAIMMAATSAHALGKFGVRGGAGVGFYISDEDVPVEPDIGAVAVGGAWVVSLALVELEVDALWRRNTVTVGELETVEDYVSFPLIAKLTLPVVPTLLSASLGIGVEPRVHLSTEVTLKGDASGVEGPAYESTVMYMPVVLGADFELPPIARVGVELRYEQQLSAAHDQQGKDRVHTLMTMAGLFF